jgi:hypothetical protein
VNQPTPAIVAQGAVRRLPRLALWLLCWAYVLPGFIGREPWKNVDMAAFGYMTELAHSGIDDSRAWLHPQLMGLAPEVSALLPYWIGAWAIQLAPQGMAADLAARLPFIALLMLTLAGTWYGVYHLARSPGAQPVAFAFGGEAHPTDYARAMADGGLLAFMGCLGLAQLAHETTPALTQLCCTALIFYAAAALPSGQKLPWLSGGLGLWGLTLSGAPSMALLLGTGVTILQTQSHTALAKGADRPPRWVSWAWLSLVLSAAGLAWGLELWHWQIKWPQTNWSEWRGLARLLIWFTWPVWPLALWTLWRWRRQLGQWQRHRHLAVPLWFSTVAIGATLSTPLADRSLLLALPALATLAAFALPTLERSVAALIDWFTLLFFSGCAVVIWVVWVSMQTGLPRQPASNVMRLAPGFVHSFAWLPLTMALLASMAWIWLVYWRTARHRAAIWKSMILPAGGAVLCWVLLMSLWMPLLDYARSYEPVMTRITGIIGQLKPRTPNDAECVQVQGISREQIAALKFYGHYTLVTAQAARACHWQIIAINKGGVESLPTEPTRYAPRLWSVRARVRRPADKYETFLILHRVEDQASAKAAALNECQNCESPTVDHEP